MKALLGILAAALIAAAAGTVLTLTPTQHDFGKTAVQGDDLKQFLVSSTTGDRIGVAVTGPNASDFLVDDYVQCFNPAAACMLDVLFRPQALGVKTAVLRLTNARGERATASLRGEGVVALCEMKVVPCNYAHLYSGTFSWKIDLRDADTQDQTNVIVNVIKGEAVCNGTYLSNSAGVEPIHGTISGPGLIGVEFLTDPMYPLVYRISVACPTTRLPDVDSRPATLGNSNSIETMREPVSATGVDLAGTITYPAPEADPVNGVSGTVAITWNLKR